MFVFFSGQKTYINLQNLIPQKSNTLNTFNSMLFIYVLYLEISFSYTFYTSCGILRTQWNRKIVSCKKISNIYNS